MWGLYRNGHFSGSSTLCPKGWKYYIAVPTVSGPRVPNPGWPSSSGSVVIKGQDEKCSEESHPSLGSVTRPDSG